MMIHLDNPTGRSTQVRRVILGKLQLYFSYNQCIGARYGELKYRPLYVPNHSRTTSRHMSELGINLWSLLDNRAFEAKVVELMKVALDDETRDTSLAYQ